MVDIHKHCPVCGTPIPLDEKVCSDKCQQVINTRQSKINKTRISLYVIIIIFIIIWVYMTFFNKI